MIIKRLEIEMANLWSGRFEKGMDKIVEEFNASIFFDKRLYDCDIEGSIAHVTMLSEQGIVTESEKEQIVHELNNIKSEIEKGEIEFKTWRYRQKASYGKKQKRSGCGGYKTLC